jgi:23S rRNA pseudouridine955/2504/2580 synthase
MRIDRWIRNNIDNIPQSLVEKNLRIGKIKLNKKKVKSSVKLKLNDEINFINFKFEKKYISKKVKYQPTNQIIKENENLIIDNNNDFIVLNKECGISVQGGTKSKKNLMDIFAKSEIFKNTKPYSVHRLDKETSGVFIIAKNRDSARLFTSLFRLRKIHKTYLAICHGEIEKNTGVWNNNLVRYEGKKQILEKAKTIFKVLDKNYNCSLVELKPITGRKHQLRKQLFAIGHSIYGDNKYKLGNINKSTNKELMLHSYQIRFMINDKKFTYTALLPNYFKQLLKKKRLKFLNF